MRACEAVQQRVLELRADLDPVRLLAEIRSAQQALAELADVTDARGSALPIADESVPLDKFISGLRTAWRHGEVRPTSKPRPQAKRGRRRPDPLIAVTDDLRAWFDADPASTGRELLERLQQAYPGSYPDCLLRTVQRRLKTWRREQAHALVFGRDGQHQSSANVPALSRPRS